MIRFPRLMSCVAVLAVTGLGLTACGERAQTASTAKKSDTKPWEIAADPYVASGWKTGDRASWEEQIRNRAQTQNEYNRTTSK
jgi:hypothetical protein